MPLSTVTATHCFRPTAENRISAALSPLNNRFYSEGESNHFASKESVNSWTAVAQLRDEYQQSHRQIAQWLQWVVAAFSGIIWLNRVLQTHKPTKPPSLATTPLFKEMEILAQRLPLHPTTQKLRQQMKKHVLTFHQWLV